MTQSLNIDQIRSRARATWSAGDYPQIASRQIAIAGHLCEWADVSPGSQVLDIGTATGNVAIAAARRGAHVTAVDITPRMLELARAHADLAGVHVEFVEADAEDLPLPADRFDCVLSACGLWFAPRPPVATAEAGRVLREGGLLGLANFTPTGFFGQLNDIIKRRIPAPEGMPEPNEWAVESTVLQRLCKRFYAVECKRSAVRYSFATGEDAADFFTRFSPPHVVAANGLAPEDATQLKNDIAACARMASVEPGKVEIDAEYLLVRARAR
jgi:ubiquinone/menaquinone biosynthesis C-methylase UbiE